MNWYRQNSAFRERGRKTGRRRLIAATALIILLILIDIVTGGRVRELSRGVNASLWNAGSGFWQVVGDSAVLRTKRSLEAENGALRERIARLEEASAGIGALREENEALRSLVKVVESAQSRGVTAPIISSRRSSPYGTFHIGAGSRHGVTNGSLVLSDENFVVGRVSDVGESTSVAVELFAPETAIEGSVRGIAFLLEGQGSGNARGKVPRQSAVVVGDIVTSPNLGGRPIGVVGKVLEDEGGSYTQLYIRLPVNLLHMKYVWVVQ